MNVERRGFLPRIVISDFKGREAEFFKLAAHFEVAVWVNRESPGDFLLDTPRLDFFLAQLRQHGFEFEERLIKELDNSPPDGA